MHGTLSRNSVIGIVNCDLRVFMIQCSALEEHFRRFIVLRRFLQVTREAPSTSYSHLPLSTYLSRPGVSAPRNDSH